MAVRIKTNAVIFCYLLLKISEKWSVGGVLNIEEDQALISLSCERSKIFIVI